MTDEPATEVGEIVDTLRRRCDELEARLAAAAQESEQILMMAELRTEAVSQGIVDLDGLKLVDVADLVVDADGRVQGATTTIAKLKRSKPWLFTRASSSSTASAPAHQKPRAKLATEMTTEEWRAARSDILRKR
jgi:hypothetical protein